VSDAQHAYEDGNALAGPLGEIFAIDVTTVESVCAGCGSTDALARLQVYARGPGYVARCPGCSTVVLRFARTPDAGWLDVRGAIRLRVPLPVS
jgi:hypothetical protein